MTLQEKIGEDLKEALKSGKKERTEVLRFVRAQIHNREIEKHAREKNVALTDEEVTETLQREVKKRKESVELFKKGNREDLAKREENEILIISEYLPKPLAKEEIGKVINEIIASGAGDFNGIMKEAMKRLKGKAGGKEVGEIIQSKLKK